LNRVISFGIDVKYVKVLQIVAESNPKTILDIAIGTEDLLAQTNAEKLLV
jgi:demethylmenaquinone methyltransferase/2-methoxy-6-polyprenyl-1,4-benzoquinol methylase